jgi:hypothetical protein
MSFTLRKLKYRPWPVTVKLLESDDAGQVVESEFNFVAHFKPFSEAEIKALAERTIDAKVDGEKKEERAIAELLEKNHEFFSPLLDGWSKVVSEAGEPLPYHDETLHAMVTGPDGMAISAGLHNAIREIRFGVAPAKNLPTSAAPGPNPDVGEVKTNLPAISAPLA